MSQSLQQAMRREAMDLFIDLLDYNEASDTVDRLSIRLERKPVSEPGGSHHGEDSWRIRVSSRDGGLLQHEVELVIEVLKEHEESELGWSFEIQNTGLEIRPFIVT